MPDPLSIDFNQPVPLFPLPDCVLLPHTTIPLHIFEPRYRAMTADAIAGRKLIAMALFEGDHWRQNYEGKPPLRPVVGLGYIIKDMKLPDGRYHLLLQGVARARIEHELHHDPYRIAMLEPLQRDQVMDIELTNHRRRIDALLDDPALKNLATINAVSNHIDAEVTTDTLIDIAAMACADDTEQRYAILAETDVFARADWLTHLLRRMRDTVRTADRTPAPEGPTHGHVN